MKQKLTGIFALLFATVIWGGAFVAQGNGMDLLGPFTFQAIRAFLAVLAMALCIPLLEHRELSDFRKKWTDPKLWKVGTLCGLALFAATSLQQISLVDTDPGKTGFLTAMYILFVPILGLFFRQKLGPMVAISIPLAVAGMYFLCCAGGATLVLSDLLLFGCAIAFAVQITLVDRHGQGLDSIRLNCVQALVVSVLSVPFALNEHTRISNIWSCSGPLLYAGVLSMGLAYSLQIVGQKRIASTPAALIMSLESVFALLFGVLLDDESMNSAKAIGCFLIFTAIILSQLPTRKKTFS
jgi:drug/metabolite transporter (DMT)-like permease